MSPTRRAIVSLWILLLLSSSPPSLQSNSNPTVCIIGSGIGGSSVAHFLRRYSLNPTRILMFERNAVVGGRMATVTISGETFEAGASILYSRNYHAFNYTKYLNLKTKEPSWPSSLGIWDGKQFVLRTISVRWNVPIVKKLVSLVNAVYVMVRYGFSLLKMQAFVGDAVGGFSKYYQDVGVRPVFDSVDGMLKWAGLYNLTTRTLQDLLIDAKVSPLLMRELVTVMTRFCYGQSTRISGLAGAVSLEALDRRSWAVEGGNWQMAAGLIDRSDVELHLNEEIESIAYLGDYYELNSSRGTSYACEVTVVATPLDEVDIQFSPPVSIPKRKLQHTHVTFVRGILNPVYFGMGEASTIPDVVGTIEDPAILFLNILVLKQHSKNDFTYEISSRKPMSDTLLDEIFRMRKETVRIDWGAYPHYNAPEVFAPFILDRQHLYYVNAFENAASMMEASAVAAENVARLILSRFFGKEWLGSSNLKSTTSAGEAEVPYINHQ